MLSRAGVVAVAMLAVLLAPAAAWGAFGSVGRQGSELIIQDDQGRSGPLYMDIRDRQMDPGVRPVQPGPGCTATPAGPRCSLDGLTAIRVFAYDGDDEVQLRSAGTGVPPVAIDVGPGRNFLDVSTNPSAGTPGVLPEVDVVGGPDVDSVQVAGQPQEIGTVNLDTGAGNDSITFFVPATATVIAGEGDDRIDAVTSGRLAIDTGPGDDEVTRGVGAPIALTGGPGRDDLTGTVGASSSPSSIDGGEGDDVITGLAAPRASLRLEGGDGDDTIYNRDTDGVTVSCGPGADSTLTGDSDHLLADCGPHLSGLDRLEGFSRCPAVLTEHWDCSFTPPRPAVVGRYQRRPRTLDVTLGRAPGRAVLALRIATLTSRFKPVSITLVNRRLRVLRGPVRLHIRLGRKAVRALTAHTLVRVGVNYTLRRSARAGDGDGGTFRGTLRRR